MSRTIDVLFTAATLGAEWSQLYVAYWPILLKKSSPPPSGPNF